MQKQILISAVSIFVFLILAVSGFILLQICPVKSAKLTTVSINKLADDFAKGGQSVLPESDLDPPLLERRNILMAKADADIRGGLVKLAKKYQQLKKARNWETVASSQSETGSIGIWLSYANNGKAGVTDVPEKYRCSLLVLIREPPSQPDQVADFPLYPNLGLAGQVGATAGNSKLQSALEKLIAESLEPLKQLESRQEKSNLFYQRLKLGLVVDILPVSGTSKYQMGQNIFVEARLKNVYNWPQVYSGGFGDTSAKLSCQIELIAPDGKAWSAEARPFQEFYNYKDIFLQPGQSVTIGRWDISQLEYNPGHIFRTMGDNGRTSLQSFARPGKYLVRWWDGVIQGGRPLVSPKLEFELVRLEE